MEFNLWQTVWPQLLPLCNGLTESPSLECYIKRKCMQELKILVPRKPPPSQEGLSVLARDLGTDQEEAGGMGFDSMGMILQRESRA